MIRVILLQRENRTAPNNVYLAMPYIMLEHIFNIFFNNLIYFGGKHYTSSLLRTLQFSIASIDPIMGSMCACTANISVSIFGRKWTKHAKKRRKIVSWKSSSIASCIFTNVVKRL